MKCQQYYSLLFSKDCLDNVCIFPPEYSKNMIHLQYTFRSTLLCWLSHIFIYNSLPTLPNIIDDESRLLRKRVILSSQIVSGIYHAISTPIATFVLYNWDINGDTLFATNNSNQVILSCLLGYFLYDCIICFMYDLSLMYKYHGLMCLSAYYFGLTSNFMTYHGLVLSMYEWSTIFLLFPVVSKEYNVWKTSSFICTALFIVAYFLVRIVLGTCFTLHTLYILYGQRDSLDMMYIILPSIGLMTSLRLNYVWGHAIYHKIKTH
jgi:hypothetical protein